MCPLCPRTAICMYIVYIHIYVLPYVSSYYICDLKHFDLKCVRFRGPRGVNHFFFIRTHFFLIEHILQLLKKKSVRFRGPRGVKAYVVCVLKKKMCSHKKKMSILRASRGKPYVEAKVE